MGRNVKDKKTSIPPFPDEEDKKKTSGLDGSRVLHMQKSGGCPLSLDSAFGGQI